MAKTVDVQLLNPFIQAALECLVKMAGCNPSRRRIFIKQDPTMFGDVAGIIGMTQGITGSCVVSFPMPLARRIVGKLLMEDPDAISDQMVDDGIGEVANMVAGGAKRQFAALGTYKFAISTPTVIRGDNPTRLFNPADTVAIACEFTADPAWPETFLIEIALKPQDKDG
jgi:CheY-specific phosphatase CheX